MTPDDTTDPLSPYKKFENLYADNPFEVSSDVMHPVSALKNKGNLLFFVSARPTAHSTNSSAGESAELEFASGNRSRKSRFRLKRIKDRDDQSHGACPSAST
jgi:hypothetical protein